MAVLEMTTPTRPPAMGHCCKDCRHWDVAEVGPRFPPTIERVGGITPGSWGTCGRVVRYGSTAHETPPGVDEELSPELSAYLSDGSGYFASLTTRADFGCNLFEGAR